MNVERFNEGSTGYLRGRLTDSEGTPIDPDDLTEATLTLWDLETGTGGSPASGIINGRDGQDILPAGSPLIMNDVEYFGDGVFQWTLQAEDNVIIDPRKNIERHRALFEFVWPTGQFTYEWEIEVVNMGHHG